MKISILMEALTGKFETDTRRASKSFERDMKRMRRDAEQMGRAIGVAVAAASTILAAMVRQQINVADEVSKTAQRIGIGTEAWSQYAHVAELSGTSIEGLQKGLMRISRTASDAQNGLATAARAFDQIGVSVEEADGSLKDTDELLLEVADRFSKMEDGAKKAALAQELFGRAGGDLIPMLNLGRDGIEALKNEADALGLTLTAETGVAAEAFNDNLTRLQAAGTGFARQLTAELLPALELISERFSDAAVESGGFRDAAASGADRIVRGLAFVMDAGASVQRVFQVWGRVLAVTLASIELGVWQLANSLINGPGKALDWLIGKANNLPGVNIEFQFGLAVPQLEGLMNRAAGIVREGVEDIQEILMAPLPGAAFLADLEGRVATIPPKAREAAAATEELAGAITQVGTAAAAAVDPLDELRRQAAAVMQANKTDAELYVDEIGRLNDMFDAGVLPVDEYNKAVIRIQDSFFPMVDSAEEAAGQVNEFMVQASRSAQTALADYLFDPAQDGFDGMVAGFADAMRRILVEAAAAQIATAMFGDGGVGSGGGWIGAGLNALKSGFGGGSRDAGGRGYPGVSYLIGRGAQPERFIPDVAGTFVPATQQGGGAVTYQTIVQAPEGRITRESEGRLRARDQQRGAWAAGRNS